MMNSVARRLLAAVLVAAAVPAAAAVPTRVYTFGDSFTDSGNAYLGTVGLTPTPAADPALGYFMGRFGDGYNFADIVSKRLTGEYATPFLAGGDNYSVGGARGAGDSFSGPFLVPGLPSQLQYYALAHGGSFVVDPDGLYIINFGNNDVNAIQSGDIGSDTVASYSAKYVSNIVQTVIGLNAGGATRIVVLGVPNPGEVEGQLLQAALDSALDTVAPLLTADLTRFDYFSFFTDLQAHPTKYNLPADVDFTTPCLAVQPVINGAADCTGYFSFDGIHVTKQVQYEIARRVLAQAGLAAIPEPGTWLLMVVGFGLVGSALRRRATQVNC